jgi:hypothetical protein
VVRLEMEARQAMGASPAVVLGSAMAMAAESAEVL